MFTLIGLAAMSVWRSFAPKQKKLTYYERRDKLEEENVRKRS